MAPKLHPVLVAETAALEVIFRRALLALANIVRFQNDVKRYNLQGHAPRPPTAMLAALRDICTKYEDTARMIEGQLRYAKAIAERDLRNATGQPHAAQPTAEAPQPDNKTSPKQQAEDAQMEDVASAAEPMKVDDAKEGASLPAVTDLVSPGELNATPQVALSSVNPAQSFAKSDDIETTAVPSSDPNQDVTGPSAVLDLSTGQGDDPNRREPSASASDVLAGSLFGSNSSSSLPSPLETLNPTKSVPVSHSQQDNSGSLDPVLMNSLPNKEADMSLEAADLMAQLAASLPTTDPLTQTTSEGLSNFLLSSVSTHQLPDMEVSNHPMGISGMTGGLSAQDFTALLASLHQPETSSDIKAETSLETLPTSSTIGQQDLNPLDFSALIAMSSQPMTTTTDLPLASEAFDPSLLEAGDMDTLDLSQFDAQFTSENT